MKLPLYQYWCPPWANDPTEAALYSANPDAYLKAYRRYLQRPPLKLSHSAMLWANVSCLAASGTFRWIRAPNLLPPDLGKFIRRTSAACLKHRNRAATQAELLEPDREDELRIAQRWAPTVFQDHKFGPKFAEWSPAVRRFQTEGVVFVEEARKEVVKCFWPIQVTLEGEACRTYYDKNIGPLEPFFVSFEAWVQKRDGEVDGRASTACVRQWWSAHFGPETKAVFHYNQILKDLRAARKRVHQFECH